MDIKQLNKRLNKILTESKKSLKEDLDDAMKSVLAEYDEKVIALATYLDIDFEPDYDSYVDEDATPEEQATQKQEAIDDVRSELDRIVDEGDNLYSYGSQEYNVYTDREADDAWDEALDYFIEQVILPEIPEAYQSYFDEDGWKRDAMIDGRGHAIARYDGDEEEIEINGTYYYIYRQN